MLIYEWVINSNSRQVGVVEFLLNNGADVHAKDKVCGLEAKLVWNMSRLQGHYFTLNEAVHVESGTFTLGQG